MKRTALMLCLVATAASAQAAGDDWPQFRGPDGQGHATATGLPTTWSESENIRWKVPVAGAGWSSPVVFGEQIWLTTSIDADQSLHAVCFHRETGETLHDVEVF